MNSFFVSNLILLFASIGLTFILIQSLIFKPIRLFLFKFQFFKELLSCAMCTGFWTGLFLAFITKHNSVECFIFGLASSFASYYSYILLEYLDKIIFKNSHKN